MEFLALYKDSESDEEEKEISSSPPPATASSSVCSSFVYFTFSHFPSEFSLFLSCASSTLAENSLGLNFQPLPVDFLHSSLTRTFELRNHQIAAFSSLLSRLDLPEEPPVFRAAGLKFYGNEQGNKIFAVLALEMKEFIRTLLCGISSILSHFGHFASALPSAEANFPHLSIFVAENPPGPEKLADQLKSLEEKFHQKFTQVETLVFSRFSLCLKSGNRQLVLKAFEE